jgi:hypothetical protein
MDIKTISGWVRQARYRAKRNNIPSDLKISDIQEAIKSFDGLCAYCDKSKFCWGTKADSLDHPFPLSQTTPNFPANVVPACKTIKTEKRQNDITWLLAKNMITKDVYLTILRKMLCCKGSETIRTYLKTIIGTQDD